MTAAGKQPDCEGQAASVWVVNTGHVPLRIVLSAAQRAAFDLVAARRTELMQAAAVRSLQVVDGFAMIRHQLPLQTRFWRGET
jgi:shikimate 5-dehydrogenase